MAATTTTTRMTHGIPTESPHTDEYESPVQRTGKWRQQRAAEQDSGLLPKESLGRILVKEHSCAMCEIGIGPDHVDNELWLWYGRPTLVDRTYPLGEGIEPLREKQKVWLYTNGADGQQWFKICGTCARRADLPEYLRVIDTPDWTAGSSLFARNLHVEATILTLQWLQLFLRMARTCMARIVAHLYPYIIATYGPLHKQQMAAHRVVAPEPATRGEGAPLPLPLLHRERPSQASSAIEALRRYCAPSRLATAQSA